LLLVRFVLGLLILARLILRLGLLVLLLLLLFLLVLFAAALLLLIFFLLLLLLRLRRYRRWRRFRMLFQPLDFLSHFFEVRLGRFVLRIELERRFVMRRRIAQILQRFVI